MTWFVKVRAKAPNEHYVEIDLRIDGTFIEMAKQADAWLGGFNTGPYRAFIMQVNAFKQDGVELFSPSASKAIKEYIDRYLAVYLKEEEASS